MQCDLHTTHPPAIALATRSFAVRRGEAPQPSPRELYVETSKEMKTAVKAGEVSSEDGKKRLESLRERLWGKPEGEHRDR